MVMDRLFLLMKEKEASDMFLSVNSPIHLKVNGNMVPINQQKMTQSTIMSLLTEVVSAAKMEELERNEPLPGQR